MKKFLSIILAAAMILACLPLTVFAADDWTFVPGVSYEPVTIFALADNMVNGRTYRIGCNANNDIFTIANNGGLSLKHPTPRTDASKYYTSDDGSDVAVSAASYYLPSDEGSNLLWQNNMLYNQATNRYIVNSGTTLTTSTSNTNAVWTYSNHKIYKNIRTTTYGSASRYYIRNFNYNYKLDTKDSTNYMYLYEMKTVYTKVSSGEGGYYKYNGETTFKTAMGRDFDETAVLNAVSVLHKTSENGEVSTLTINDEAITLSWVTPVDTSAEGAYTAKVYADGAEIATITLNVIDNSPQIVSTNADPSTSDIEDDFTLDQDQDGMIKTDKTVCYNDDEYDAFDSYEPDEFSVALSALGQYYTPVETVETQEEITEKVHPDVIFVLDASGSMRAYNVADGTMTRAQATSIALNSAIKTLYESDPETRIGIVTFANDYHPEGIYLPLDKYTLPEGQTEYITWGGRMVAAQNAPSGTSSTTYSNLSLATRTVSSARTATPARSAEWPGYDSNTITNSNHGWYRPANSAMTNLGTAQNGVTYYAVTVYWNNSPYNICIYTDQYEWPVARIMANPTDNVTTNYFADDYITVTATSSTQIRYTFNTYADRTGSKVYFESRPYMAATNFLINSDGEVVAPSSYEFVDNMATYTQAGLQAAENMYAAAGDKENHIPAIVLISDGIPTIANTNTQNPDLKFSNINTAGTTVVGTGMLSNNTSTTVVTSKELANYGLYTIETAMKVKNNVDEMYETSKTRGALFYTIGPGVSYLTGKVVLDPEDEIVNQAKQDNRVSNQNGYTEGGVGIPKDYADAVTAKYTNLDYVDYADWSYTGNMTGDEIEQAFRKVATSIVDIVRPVKSTTTTEGALDAAVVFTDVIGEGMEITSDFVVRYGNQNYAPTSATTITTGDGTRITTYGYDYRVTEESTGKIYSLNGLTVRLITEPDGKQTVKWYIAADLLPIIAYNTFDEEFLESSPIRLIYKVGLEDDTKGGTYYTNSTEEPAKAEFTPLAGNMYYYDIVEGTDGELHAVPNYPDEDALKTDNVTDTSDYSKTGEMDGSGTVTNYLGNNGVITIRYVDVEISKVWVDNDDISGVRPDSITVDLYKNGVSYIENITISGDDCTVTQNEDGDTVWTYTISHIAGGDSDAFYIREHDVSLYNASYSADGLTVTNTCYVEILPDVVVVDYGKPITISPLLNDTGATALLGVCALDEDMYEDSYTSQNGVFSVEDDDVVFSPFSYMSSINWCKYYAEVTDSNGHSVMLYSTIAVVPATTVYYEDDFGGSDENGGLYIQYTGDWVRVADDGTTGNLYANTDINDRQDRGEIGQGHVPYGYDSSYDGCTQFSNGSASRVDGTITVGDNGEKTFDAWAEFTFRGTGFDLISRTDMNCGIISVYVTGIDDPDYVENTPVINKGVQDLYQIPVISYTGIPYGTYKVRINVNAPMRYLNITGSTFYLDAIRIYDPMGTNEDENEEFDLANSAYLADKEANAYVASIRDYILSAQELGMDETNGAVYVDTIDNEYTDGGVLNKNGIADIEQIGPNEEIYLTPGKGVGFALECSGLPDSVQLEIKVPSPIAKTASLRAQTGGSDAYMDFTASCADEMFYDITDAVEFTKVITSGRTYYRALVIISNGLENASESEVISITNIKMTYPETVRNIIAVASIPDTINTASESFEFIDEDGNTVSMCGENIETAIADEEMELVSLKASWDIYCNVFDTVYTQHQATLPDYDVLAADYEGTVAKGEEKTFTFTSSQFVENLEVIDEATGLPADAEITSEIDESLLYTEDFRSAKIWSVTVTGEETGGHIYAAYAADGEGEVAEAFLTVTAPELVSLTVISAPLKTNYFRGEKLDLSGLKLKAVYSDGTEEIVTSGYTLDHDTAYRLGNVKIGVSYGGMTASFTIKSTFSLKIFLKGIFSK